MRRFALILSLTVVAVPLALSPVAAAGAVTSPSDDPATAQYGDALNNITSRSDAGGGGGGATGVLQKRVVAPLPFTGLDLVSLAVVAVALISTGLVVRRLNAARQARNGLGPPGGYPRH